MSVLLGGLAGLVGALIGWRLLAPVFAQDVFARTNYRERAVPTAAGLIVVLVVVAAEATLRLAASFDWELKAVTGRPREMVLIIVLGLGLLGLLDDLAGVDQGGGFRGHLRHLARGRLTTGSVKLFGGAAVAVAAVFSNRSDTPGRLLADAVLVALCANLANLLDRAPGRTLKASLAAFVVLAAVTGAPAELVGVSVAAGAAAALLVPDLREQLMIGDVGANAIGGAVGVGIVIATAPTTRTIVLVAVAALNLVAEVVSFSRVIERAPPLRVLDRLGRKNTER